MDKTIEEYAAWLIFKHYKGGGSAEENTVLATNHSIIDATNSRDSHDKYVQTSEIHGNPKWKYFDSVIQILKDKLKQ